MNLRKKLFKLMQTEKIVSDEYIKLAYLESSGTQMIDTGLAFQPIKAVIDVSFNEDVKTRQAMGFSSNNTTYFAKTTDGVFELGGGVNLNGSNAYQWQEVTFEHNGVAAVNNGSVGKITVGDKSISRSGTPNRPTTNFCLFNIPGYGTTLACHCKISGAKFYNANNELIADLIPILDKNFIPCMYDKVRHKFLYNQGEGEFKWRLPNQLECLESDGNQYLNIGIIPNDKIGVKAKFYVNSASGKNYVVGSRGDGVGRFYLYSTESSAYVKYGYGAFYTTNITPVVGTPVEASLNYLNDRKYIYNGTEVNSNLPQTDFSDNTYDMYLFSSNFANVFYNDAILNGRIYYCQITQGDKVAMYLIPVFDEDLTPCMYDLVSKQYLRNQGTGSFKGYFEDGSQLVSYLESDGNQWIDSGIECTSDLKVEFMGSCSTVVNAACCGGIDLTNNPINFRHHWSPHTASITAGGHYSLNYWCQKNSAFDASINPPYTLGDIVEVMVDGYNGLATVNGVDYSFEPLEDGLTTGKNYGVFARIANTGDIQSRPCKFWYFKIYKKDELVRHLLPVLDKNLTPCMYDLISSKHFYNKGSGEFGWILQNQLECLESTGTQYIDTGFLSKDLYDKSLYIKMKTTGGTSSYAYNGAYHTSGTGLTIQFGLLATSDTLCRTTMNHFDTSYLNVTDLQKSEYTEMMMTPTEYWVNGEFKANHEQTSVDQILETNNKFLLFGRSQYNQSNSITPMMISEFWIKDVNGKFVQYLVPVFDENRVACMYDLVSKKYFLNENTTSNFTPILFNTGLFDPQNINFIPGYVSTNNSGNITESTLTDTYYIPCEPNTSYIISRTHIKQSGQVWRAATVSESPYTGMLCPNYVGGLIDDLTLTITSGENDKYLMFSEGMTKSTDDLSKFSVYKSI